MTHIFIGIVQTGNQDIFQKLFIVLYKRNEQIFDRETKFANNVIASNAESKLKFALDTGDAKTDNIEFARLRNIVMLRPSTVNISYNPTTISKALANRLTKLLKHNKNINWQRTCVRYM